MRSEQSVFDDLAALCLSVGFIHAIAFISLRDNVVGFKDELNSDELLQWRSHSQLIRTEITTLIGLMMRGPIDFSMPTPTVLNDYIKKSAELLDELHLTMVQPTLKLMQRRVVGGSVPNANPFSTGESLREPIFYAGESAYPFQYRDLALTKYSLDSDWLSQNKSVDLVVGKAVCDGIPYVLNRSLETVLSDQIKGPAKDRAVLPFFTFSCTELASYIGFPTEDVQAFVNAFTLPSCERNAGFSTINDFNKAYIYPFIRRDVDKYVLLQYYGLTEAFYETPFYWMCTDSLYAPTALTHRGDFTESFTYDRLVHVFGSDRVYKNVELRKTKGHTLGEIDVLVIFGDRVVLVQSKSKRLTLESRRGNDRVLRSDFRMAIQDAVEQSFECAKLLGDQSVSLYTKNNEVIRIEESQKVIFPVAIIADHYPALAFQLRQFLEYKSTTQILPPLVTDVFSLDAISEMLSTPLWFLSYLELRARFGERLMASHEHMLLSYHLRHNLWLRDDIDLMLIDDDFSVHLDTAMAVRRDGIDGIPTPDGILTRLVGTPLGSILKELETSPDPLKIDLGLFLITLSDDVCKTINKNINRICNRHLLNKKSQTVRALFPGLPIGLFIYCSRSTVEVLEEKFHRDSKESVYPHKLEKWFGLVLKPDGSVKHVFELVN